MIGRNLLQCTGDILRNLVLSLVFSSRVVVFLALALSGALNVRDGLTLIVLFVCFLHKLREMVVLL